MTRAFIILLIFVSILCFNCRPQQDFSINNSNKHRLNTYVVGTTEVENTNNFAFKTFTNCYSGEFPIVNSDLATKDFLTSWQKIQDRFARICNKYGHSYGKPNNFKLFEILGDDKGNKYFIYRITFPHASRENQVIIVKNDHHLLSKIEYRNRWDENY